MSQPTCDGFSPLPDVVQELPRWYHDPAVWFWIGLTVALIAFEVWAKVTGQHSPSQFTQGRSKVFGWFRAIGLTLWALLGFHLFFERVM